MSVVAPARRRSASTVSSAAPVDVALGQRPGTPSDSIATASAGTAAARSRRARRSVRRARRQLALRPRPRRGRRPGATSPQHADAPDAIGRRRRPASREGSSSARAVVDVAEPRASQIGQPDRRSSVSSSRRRARAAAARLLQRTRRSRRSKSPRQVSRSAQRAEGQATAPALADLAERLDGAAVRSRICLGVAVVLARSAARSITQRRRGPTGRRVRGRARPPRSTRSSSSVKSATADEHRQGGRVAGSSGWSRSLGDGRARSAATVTEPDRPVRSSRRWRARPSAQARPGAPRSPGRAGTARTTPSQAVDLVHAVRAGIQYQQQRRRRSAARCRRRRRRRVAQRGVMLSRSAFEPREPRAAARRVRR